MAKAEKGSAKRGRSAKAALADAVVPAKSPSSDAVVGFEQEMKHLVATLDDQFKEGARLEKEIRKNLRGLGHGA